MKAKYLMDFIKDEEKEEFKKQNDFGNKSFTRNKIREKYLEIAEEITKKINDLEDQYESGQMDLEEYTKRKDILMDLRIKNRNTYLGKN